MDTEAIASEIVYLKNRIAELDEESVEEKQQLHERLRGLQDQLSGAPSTGKDRGGSQADKVQYVPPS